MRKREKGAQVDQVGNDEIDETTQALEKAIANLSSTSVTEPGLMQLPELAAQVGAHFQIGRILLAGQVRNGTFWVQFNIDEGGGFASIWPRWAFELAKAALLSNKMVGVFSKGDPVGWKLLQVILLDKDTT